MSSSTRISRVLELALALALALVTPARAQTAGRIGADFALRDLGGNTVRLSDFRGKIVLINFWATWCKPCAAELPHLQRMYVTHAAKGVVILGVSMDGPETAADVVTDVRRYGLTYPILLDEETRVVAMYNPKSAAPFTVLIGRDGTIARTREGYSAGDEVKLEAELVGLLAEKVERKAVPVDVTSTTTAGVRKIGDVYGELYEKLNISGGSGRWHVAARVDGAGFVSEPSSDIDDRYVLEKATATYAARAVDVTAGDAYVSFGRGLALSLRKIDELGIDTTVRGAKVVTRTGPLEGTLVAGYANINNVDEATSRSRDDTYDLIGGAQLAIRLPRRFLVGLYGSAVAFRDALGLAAGDEYRDRIGQVGAMLDAPNLLDNAGLYVEAIVQAADTEPASEERLAFGMYATATVAASSKATLLVEGKSYGSLIPLNPRLDNPFESVAYNNPPTAERKLQPLENPQRNIAGARARLEWRFTPGAIGFVNYGAFRDWLGYADPDTVGSVRDGTIHDPYAGLELRWDEARSWAISQFGYRFVILDGSGERVRGDAHAELNVVHRLDRCYSITLQGLHRERLKAVSPILTEAFREGSIDAGVRIRSAVTLSAGYDYTTEPTQPKRDYFHGNFTWDVSGASSIRLFVGSARGGLRCISGVCRVFPPFEGAKVTVTVRY